MLPRLSSLWRTRHACGIALVLLLVGAVLRCPPIVLRGRVWAEESNVMLGRNWSLTFAHTLGVTQFGYYSLWNNFWSAVAIHLVALQFAAHLFTGTALVVLLLTGYLVYQAEFLRTPGVKFAAVLALLVTTGDVESWLNLINSQFAFGLWSAVILCCDASRLQVRRGLALGLAVLSGPITVLLAPLFFARAWRWRTRGALVQAGIVLAGSVAQLSLAATAKTGNRKLHLTPSIIGPVVLVKDVVMPLFSRPAAILAGRVVLRNTGEPVPLCWLVLLCAAAALVWLFRRNRVCLVLLGTALWLGMLQCLLSLGGTLLDAQPGFGERYAYVPDALLMLALLAAVSTQRGSRLTVARWLLGGALLAGTIDFLWLPLRVPSSYDAPSWYTQGVAWQTDERVPLQPTPNSWPALHLLHAPL